MDRINLLTNLRTYFNESELQDVCFFLDIDYENLNGNNKIDKSRELITFTERNNQISELFELCNRLRPAVSWSSRQPQNNISEMQKSNNLSKILSTAEEILEQANKSLIRNQKVLAPLFTSINPAEKQKVYENMMTLYQNQRSRGDFGQWNSFLEAVLQTEEEERLKELTSELLLQINRLYDAFYSEKFFSQSEGSKSLVLETLASLLEEDSLNQPEMYNEVRQTAEFYLSNLRATVEEIGRIVGSLKSMMK